MTFLCPPRDKVLKLVVDMLSGQPKENVVSTLRLTRTLMVKYECRVSFATEGGVKAILSCMQEYPTVPQIQQVALAVSSQSLCCELFLLLPVM